MRIVQWIALALAVFAAPMAQAQPAADYPTGPVRLLVPFAAGGPTDVVMRILGRAVVGALGRQDRADREPSRRRHHRRDRRRRQGAAGRPHALLVATNSLLINPAISQVAALRHGEGFRAGQHDRGAAGGARRQQSFEGSTVAEVVAEAKKQPTNYTSPGPRGVGDLAGQMLKQRAGIPAENFTHINYNGSAPALTDVIAGRVPLMFDIWHSAQALRRIRASSS